MIMEMFSASLIIFTFLTFGAKELSGNPYHKNFSSLTTTKAKSYARWYNMTYDTTINGRYDSAIEEKITLKLFHLPEAKISNAYITSFTHNAHGLSALVMGWPDSLNKYYWVALGYNSEIRFETYYNFYVWPDTMLIKFYDTRTGKAISLKEWRKNRRPEDVIK